VTELFWEVAVRLVVAMTGATGAIIGIRLLEPSARTARWSRRAA
jgi:3-polyprenyl-4-hydroxybenzoate decarboxylase